MKILPDSSLDLKLRIRRLKARFDELYHALDAKERGGYGSGHALFEARGELQAAERFIWGKHRLKSAAKVRELEAAWLSKGDKR